MNAVKEGAYLRKRSELKAFRISPKDTNYFALQFDPFDESGSPFTSVIEIFTVGGKTPPNSHNIAYEMFYVLKGEGIARCDGKAVPLQQGDTLMLTPGRVHEVENTGAGKLYCLTVMVPNEGFAELIRNGTPVDLDAEDWLAIRGS